MSAAESNGSQAAETQPCEIAAITIQSLVAEHSTLLYRYAYRLTGSSSDAEDLVQQTFLVALRKLDQLREPGAARGWLFTVLRHAFLKLQRQHSELSGSSLTYDIEELAVDFDDDPQIDSEQIQTAINELPAEFKLVLVSYYFEECSYKEIAERLSLPLGTVMSRLSRAKNHLRTSLTQTPATSTNGRMAQSPLTTDN